ncbi:MAG: DNA adenine methylase [Verrucomicrobiota bacterium]
MFHRIIREMPPHRVYVEPFFGSGQIFWRKRRAARSIIIDKLPGLLAKAGAEAGVSVHAGDAIEQLRCFVFGDGWRLPADTLVYADPPYMLSTRGGRRYYEHEMTDEDHAALLSTLTAAKFRVIISHPVCPLYLQHLRGWRCVPFKTMTRGGMKPDAIWMNYPEPTELHDWNYAGRNFRERLSLKRLASRYVARLSLMSPVKRGYILRDLAASFPALRAACEGPQRQNGQCPPAVISENGAVICESKP